MQIDWFTFGAQIVNFLILVGLLKRFLYGPIVEAMDQREAEINERLQTAERKQTEAEEKVDQYETMKAELETQRKEAIAEAERDARQRRQELLDEARQEVDHLETEWREALRREQDAFLNDVSERAVRESIALAHKALADLADADLEDQTLTCMIDRLRHLDDSERTTLADALSDGDGAVTVRSAFSLSDAQHDRLQDALADCLGISPALSTETDRSLGFGIEIRINNRKVAWTLESYLSDVLDRTRQRLDEEMQHDREAPSNVPAERPH